MSYVFLPLVIALPWIEGSVRSPWQRARGMGEPLAITHGCVFLASDESKYMAGPEGTRDRRGLYLPLTAGSTLTKPRRRCRLRESDAAVTARANDGSPI